MAQLTPYQRMRNGVHTMNHWAKKGVLPMNWRFLVDVVNMRFASGEFGPPVQLLGKDRWQAWKKINCHFAGQAEQNGFVSLKIPDDHMKLRKAWEFELMTEMEWTKEHSNNRWYRVIRGLVFRIEEQENTGKYKLEVIESMYDDGNRDETTIITPFPADYSNLDSAKRAVRNFVGKRGWIMAKKA